ncbi:hypothetical protein GCM10009430_07930 [Aquimarina litoralis]|uniref:Secretion system C-terminal sorting domain-containing protein n=1 Tax=Aquimarina litoralis TaxID=584605 RepID=A0ABN1III8_9FLAO
MSKQLLFITTLICIISVKAQNISIETKLTASDRAAVDNFGWSIDVDNNYAVIGAPFKNEFGSGGAVREDVGAVYIFETDNTGNWNEVNKISASDAQIDDRFGWTVAVDGIYIVVGAPYEDEDVNGMNTLNNAGAIYIYERDDTTGIWSEVQKIVASDRQENDNFGYAVAIDDDFIAVGSFLEDEDGIGNNTIQDAGSVYMIKKGANGIWGESQKIVASDRDFFNWFGEKVSISNDYLVVAAKEESEDAQGNNYLGEAGAAYIFHKDGSDNWSQTQKITASDRSVFANFGTDVSIDGNFIAVGAILEGEDALGQNTLTEAGAAYIFEKTNSGIWIQVDKLVPSDRNTGDEFGISVSIHGDHVIVGANREDEDENGGNTLNSSGSAYIYERDSFGSWNQIQKVVASDRSNVDNFGFDVSLSEEYAFIGANWENEDENDTNSLSNSGSVYLVNRSPLLNVIEQPDTESYFSLFPNPVKEQLFVEFENIQSKGTIKIYDLLGREKYIKNYNNVKRMNITFEGVAGYYFVKIEDVNGAEIIKKFIKL